MRLSMAALLVGTATATNNPAYKWGHAAYTYGPLLCEPGDVCAVVPSCNRAGFAPAIEQFNLATADTTDDFSTILSYGGDIEFWAGPNSSAGCAAPASTDPSVCNVSVYYDPNNAKAAEVYKNVSGVKSITALVDSRMDGWTQIQEYNNNDNCSFGDFYPDLNNLTNASMIKLAADTAKLYCAADVVDGIQVDLEPYSEIYSQSLNSFISLVGKNLLDEDNTFGCRDEAHPTGRAVSYFCFAHDIYHRNGNVTPSPFNDLLGPNGYYVFAAYDLYPDPDDGGFMFNTPDGFKQRFATEAPFFRKVLGSEAKFTLALPLGASCHEYEYYRPQSSNMSSCGPACQPQASGFTMDQYAQAAFDFLLDPQTTQDTDGLFCMSEATNSQFLGISWWSFSVAMTYPPMKWFNNEFLPGSPPPAALEVVRQNLPKLQDGTTCTPKQRAAMGLLPAVAKPHPHMLMVN